MKDVLIKQGKIKIHQDVINRLIANYRDQLGCMIQPCSNSCESLTNPERLIELLSTLLSGWFGYAALFGIVFAETGLLMGFFLPGDSLLFTVGVVAGAGQLNIVLVNVLLMAAAILGDSTGYLLGRKTGPQIFNRPDSRLLQAGVPHPHPRILREVRRQDDRLRALRADRADLRRVRRRGGQDAVPAASCRSACAAASAGFS